MQKTILPLFALLLLITFASATQVNVTEFYSFDCPHCMNVKDSGVLERVAQMPNVTFSQYDVKTGEGYAKYQKYHADFPKIPEGWPLVIIEYDNETEYLIGDTPIIKNLEKTISTLGKVDHPEGWLAQLKQSLQASFDSNAGTSGKLGAVILAALIDSINPCAFGVLIFLMISLLNLGSRKRALRYGLIYTLIIFITYFLAGLGIFKVLQQLTAIRQTIYLVVGIIVLFIGLIEFNDYLKARKGKEATLRISPKLKPLIEKKTKQGTLIAILILGVLVALFELPCTGGIYLGIISLLLETKSVGIVYLLIYNLIFVLPLIIITFLIYKGMSPAVLQKWNASEKAWMRLAASIILLLIAGWLISIGI